MKRAPCPHCHTPINLLALATQTCVFCGAHLRRVSDRFELAGVPPIESSAEIATRQAAVSRLVGGVP
ncbi:MAG: hypothetical protein JNJ59_09535 [Deltaproteobacteria bacterium]|nr:hypothetical protein [Deltaproteobacteria bacterium]